MTCTAVPNSNRAFLFGGVQDDNVTNMAAADQDSDDDEEPGVFFNDLYNLTVENEKATWNKSEYNTVPPFEAVPLFGQKSGRKVFYSMSGLLL